MFWKPLFPSLLGSDRIEDICGGYKQAKPQELMVKSVRRANHPDSGSRGKIFFSFSSS